MAVRVDLADERRNMAVHVGKLTVGGATASPTAAEGSATFTGLATMLGLALSNTAVTATSDGLTTGIVPETASFVTVTSANADNIVTLPAPVPGRIVILRNGATGYELRTSAPATVAINAGSEANAESAIAASTMVVAVCTTATTWQAISLVGATLAAVAAAAA